FGPSALNVLQDSTGDGLVDPGDITVVNNGDAVTFRMHLHQDPGAHTGRVPFDTGLPGLPFHLRDPGPGSVGVGVGYDFDLDITASQQPGQPLAVVANFSAMHLNVNASAAGLDLSGQFGELAAEARDDPNEPSNLAADYAFGNFCIDAAHGLTGFAPALSGRANVQLLLNTTFGDPTGSFFPHFTANFDIGAYYQGDPTTVFPLGSQAPTVRLWDINLDLNSFLNGFVAPL